ncbi:hypothetical protein MKX08_000214 [Trichoderma sp. CBMAI-0020]|nr:hypothetical protein MKX08_000214 [Trichoderma sp. CBMAI-0020]
MGPVQRQTNQQRQRTRTDQQRNSPRNGTLYPFIPNSLLFTKTGHLSSCLGKNVFRFLQLLL